MFWKCFAINTVEKIVARPLANDLSTRLMDG